MLISLSPRRLSTILFFFSVILVYLYNVPSESYIATKTDLEFTIKSNPKPPSHLKPPEPGANVFTNSTTPNHVNSTHQLTRSSSNSSVAAPVKGPNIRQVTVLLNNGGADHEMYERALKTHYAHGDRWGYSTHVLRQDIVGSTDAGISRLGQWKTGVFKKPLYLLSMVVNELAKPAEDRAEWIVWFDADTIILNPQISWTDFLPPASDPHFNTTQFLGNKDWNGFNCGVFFMRVSEWTVNMLNDVSALPRLRKDIDLFSSGRDRNAMKHIFKWEGREEQIVFQPRAWYNGFHSGKDNSTEVVEGDLLVHFAGFYGNRSGGMGEWMDKLERTPEKFAVPLEETGLKEDIEDFWTTLGQAKTRLLDFTHDLHIHNTTTTRQIHEELRKVMLYDPANKDRLVKAMNAAEKAMIQSRKNAVSRQPNIEAR